MTKDEKKNKKREYYQKNKEKIKAKSKAWAIAHPEKRKEISQKWYSGNMDLAKARAKKCYEKNPEATKESSKKWQQENPDKVLEYRKAHCVEIRLRTKRWRQNNKGRRNEYEVNRVKNDPCYHLLKSLRSRIRNTVKRGSKSARTQELLGCSLEAFKAHIESLWKPGMAWDNYGLNGWHIDHIRPCSSFNLLDPEEQRKCFHWSNMQPLWEAENLAKGDSYPHQESFA